VRGAAGTVAPVERAPVGSMEYRFNLAKPPPRRAQVRVPMYVYVCKRERETYKEEHA
jgi:hypothetical protein